MGRRVDWVFESLSDAGREPVSGETVYRLHYVGSHRGPWRTYRGFIMLIAAGWADVTELNLPSFAPGMLPEAESYVVP